MQLAADANVLLSAVIGGRARLILVHPQIEQVFTTQNTFEEVEEYAPILGKKRRIAADRLLLAVASLPVTIVGRDEYSGRMAEARRRIGRRDPDDVDLLALALEKGVAIWSNDRDFEEARFQLYTTAQLLRHLHLIR